MACAALFLRHASLPFSAPQKNTIACGEGEGGGLLSSAAKNSGVSGGIGEDLKKVDIFILYTGGGEISITFEEGMVPESPPTFTFSLRKAFNGLYLEFF